jgi:Sigma-70, region 4
MSAALQLPMAWEASPTPLISQQDQRKPALQPSSNTQAHPAAEAAPDISLAFYRGHTENLLRRYLYASMLVGRTPSILNDPVGRGWASSRPVRTFEDAIIFVLDIERCLAQLNSLDREMLCRIVLQEYTQAEAASLLGMCVRTISNRFPQALDRLTKKLMEADLLVLPQ